MLRCVVVPSMLLVVSSAVFAQPSTEFSTAVKKLPSAEKAIELFNGTDLTGWQGDPSRWSVVDGVIRGANDDTVPSSTYLFTDKSYRNFRLLLEVKQTIGPKYSTMHSAVCALGERFTDKGDNNHGFKGPLLMFSHDWGIWDAYRRNRVVDRGPGPKVEKKGQWNLIEILVIGNRIRFAANGTQIFDFTDQPEMLQTSPIGLQLHSNGKPQEHQFRGLILTENPEDRLVTTKPVYTQLPEVQDSVERGAQQATPPAENKVAISDADFNSGPNAKWIWGEDNNKDYILQTTFQAANAKSAVLKASSDNVGTVFVNGKQVTTSTAWEQPMSADVTKHIFDGKNTIIAKVANRGGIAAFVLKLALRDDDGNVTHVVTDGNWTIATKNLDNSRKVSLRGNYGDAPWGSVFSASASYSGRVPRGVFEVLPGFQVEKLFTVPKEELGSWVCIAFDNKGRLLASDQGNKGICRITLPPTPSLLSTGGEGGRRPDEGGSPRSATIVEPLDFSNCEFQPTGAQGMLYAFDSLYFSINGSPGSGLYRAKDLDGDDQFDECVKLKDFRGGGEHGPHSLRLSPDGKRIFVIAGNHTDPPFKAGDERTDKNYSSRIPTNWGEDLLLPRMWDANGHARGKLAPGGWIASTDPDGKTWEIWSIGYRNPYDMAFNADGELFAYDADMEWDFGAPWYRPTRVVHATSGSEFGWRSGTGKWPTYYMDSLPPLVNIGPGSPVGVDFGYGLKFPAKYQKALYICDWTFGTIYAIHTQPDKSTYTATKEEFVSRSPLPLTDVAAGPDGALYFSVGGRGTQSELYRVTYVGNERTEPTVLKNESFAGERKLRHFAEQYHRPDVTINEVVAGYYQALADGLPTKKLNLRSDRALASAVRRVIQTEAVASHVIQFLEKPQQDIDAVLEVVTAMARGAEQTGLESAAVKATSVKALHDIEFAGLSTSQQLNYLRSLSLVFLRLGYASDEDQTKFLPKLDDHFPSTDGNLNRELCQMLVYLKSPTVVARTIELMNQEPQRQDIDMTDLLARNAGYGKAIHAMIANQPDKDQVWYAFCLRVAKTGWTPESRADYFRWFAKAQKWSGGNSFVKFLQNISDEAYATTTENERVMLEAMGARTPFTVPELPKPAGPGKDWSLGEVRTLAQVGLTNRSFANGQKMFAATRCILCHRFAGDGGATGPDLTQLAGRFKIDALTEAILDPSKVISDQYKASTVVTTAGKSVSGRIVSENDEQISVLTDPEDSTKIVDIRKDDIDEILASTTSIMPGNLLKPLNREEVLDLLAYLLSRGDEKNEMFRK
ncbi:MAG: family 16 glycoside hydrolase [Fuerstiella sp.]